jgi:hypothetical protein
LRDPHAGKNRRGGETRRFRVKRWPGENESMGAWKSIGRTGALAAVSLLLQAASPGIAADTNIYTNQTYLEDAMGAPDRDIRDVKAVFRMVLGSLPDTVTVYPTENYYYFNFYHGGIKYAGNFRFDIGDRDRGLIHFNYFKDFTPWQRDESDFSAVYGKKDAVDVSAAGPLAYRVAFEGKNVLFQLNALSGVKPPADAVQPGETYIGPVFDESGIRFFLVFNEELKIFMFILDETVATPEQFNTTDSGKSLTIGIRTGFVFHADKYANRKILVGVNQANTSVNNYFDGPFDQLPDNFLKGDVLLNAILAASPEMKGQIDRFGNSPDGLTRYLIAPYLQYENETDLAMIEQCASEEMRPIYYNCFSFVGSGDGGGEEGEPDAQ